VDLYHADRVTTPGGTARDIMVWSPATEDSPAMLSWVAAELDEAGSSRDPQTLAYRLESAAPTAPRAQPVSAASR
jgi:hypothetical protein